MSFVVFGGLLSLIWIACRSTDGTICWSLASSPMAAPLPQKSYELPKAPPLCRMEYLLAPSSLGLEWVATAAVSSWEKWPHHIKKTCFTATPHTHCLVPWPILYDEKLVIIYFRIPIIYFRWWVLSIFVFFLRLLYLGCSVRKARVTSEFVRIKSLLKHFILNKNLAAYAINHEIVLTAY